MAQSEIVTVAPISLPLETQSKDSVKLAIVGQGAIGGLLALQCYKQGYNYQLLLRKNATSEKPFSLQIEDIRQQVTTISPHISALNQVGDFDLLILPIKAYQVLPALIAIQKRIQPHHIIVLLHNGMGTIEQVKQLLPENPCIAATTSYGAFKPAPAYVKQTGLGETHLGWITPCDPNVQPIVEKSLSTLLPPSVWHQDISLALWKKLAVNAVINPLTAIKNIKNGELADKQFSPLTCDICVEISLIMKHIGYQIEADELVEIVMQVIDKTADNYSSMHQDIYHNRKTEIEFINGYVVQKALALGLNVPKSVPQNEKLLRQIKELSKTS